MQSLHNDLLAYSEEAHRTAISPTAPSTERGGRPDDSRRSTDLYDVVAGKKPGCCRRRLAVDATDHEVTGGDVRHVDAEAVSVDAWPSFQVTQSHAWCLFLLLSAVFCPDVLLRSR